MIYFKEYWNKVIDDRTAPFGRRVLKDEYELHREWQHTGELQELKKRVKNNPRMTIHADHIREDCGREFGIHSYRIITGQ
uniref:Uncharacterized protein n=1 Tax=viral metagenome TaxID=1070528 RepID=A0A6H1ZVA4_9ZZZZ